MQPIVVQTRRIRKGRDLQVVYGVADVLGRFTGSGVEEWRWSIRQLGAPHWVGRVVAEISRF